MVLSKMKEAAEVYLGKEVTDAVITVPAYFNVNQRQATIDAGKLAGLNVLRLVNEPTAAAIAYGLDRKSDEQRNVLVFDLGGGTFDVSILSIEKGKFEVKAVGGDTHLGGEDFDSQMVDHFVELFNQQHKGKDLASNRRAISRLKVACETAKRMLCSSEHASIDLEALYGDIDFRASITKSEFETLKTKFFATCADNQPVVLVQVYEGERPIAEHNNLLGKFQLSGIPPAPRGESQIEVTFDIDVNGVLHVSAVDESAKKQSSIIITKDTGRLSEEEIEQMLIDAEKYKQADEKQKSKIEAKINLENLIFSTMAKVESKEVKQISSKESIEDILKVCKSMMNWVDIDQDATKEDYELKRQTLQTLYSDAVTKKSDSLKNGTIEVGSLVNVYCRVLFT
ncbi:unnamed protein product [Taenia asiatica]|uniref:Heat shock protein 70 n=1 Tax=Taenia asiatica TaxID=60517 RepID=A0A0R3WGM9_TAEAS|nr:unnamed protein product [Taenia asiatica]